MITDTTPATKGRGSTPSGFRPEIQALRAAAVIAVVVYHIWPTRLRGGYVGVDVFFVISGYLITGHLWRELSQSSTIRLGQFWARRARRLLPASLLVLAVTGIATFLWAPQARWGQFFQELLASALYVENWRLASDSVDYLAAENAASPVQHYWTLSLEEQFYVIWPLMMLAAVGIGRWRARGRPRARTAVVTLLGTTAIASFVYCLWLTSVSPAAYFSTPARMWQFALGGLVALLIPAGVRAARWATICRLVGWAMLLVSVYLFTEATSFPGYAALLPTLGAVAIIVGGTTTSGLGDSFYGRLISLRPVQYVGAISYSTYLWHWPLVVMLPPLLGIGRPFALNVGLLSASLVLGALTKTFVEDPCRRAKFLVEAPAVRTLTLTLGGMAVVVAVAGAGIVETDRQEEASNELVGAYLESSACLGALAIAGPDAPCSDPALDGRILPALAAVSDDTGQAYWCYDTDPSADIESCTYGSSTPTARRVALVGDSHAAMLLPALYDHLAVLDWSVDTYVARGCMWRSAPPTADDACSERQRALQARLMSGGYDLVLLTARRNPDLSTAEIDSLAVSYAAAWEPLTAAGVEVVPVIDNPTVTTSDLDCVILASSPDAAAACSVPMSEALGPDPLQIASRLTDGNVEAIDLSSIYCDERCPMVIGNVAVYRDEHHITATFARTLGPILVRELSARTGR
ncbi:Peptidoglycan/LPS O-acetylase OafA/YrhL, contains acyltransferase and SGNH-hydrolase domains [Flavimobilis marinus]|uniref:Peptidoglycan/LPS O-acetylase OafA/YrhL, contains acyltransferase and SGNH-hydrolase domains n=1 Tax=Flavimobilis marinus TaxID=285351 RepID=A0A1I2GN17_9MICO|nr:Peptidoglycan/LPS O-acetylase OafA/YrhL, contains acyltransferase and SGNH-hydrolase domains [Flavimobilis marinus]